MPKMDLSYNTKEMLPYYRRLTMYMKRFFMAMHQNNWSVCLVALFEHRLLMVGMTWSSVLYSTYESNPIKYLLSGIQCVICLPLKTIIQVFTSTMINIPL